MEYSLRYINDLVRAFSAYYSTLPGNLYNREITLDNHSIFNRSFVIDISSDEIEVPVFARSAVEEVITNNLQYPHMYNTGKVIITMYNTNTRARRAADSIVHDFFSGVSFSQRLQKVITNKGEVYYGGVGIILDKDFNILLLCTIACRKIEGDNIMSYYKPIVHVSPKVFLNGGDLISRSILKKIIPFYLSHDIDSVSSRTYFRSNIPMGTNPQILIDDANKLIESPVKPSPQKCSDEVLNKVLIDNIDDVLSYF